MNRLHRSNFMLFKVNKNIRYFSYIYRLIFVQKSMYIKLKQQIVKAHTNRLNMSDNLNHTFHDILLSKYVIIDVLFG